MNQKIKIFVFISFLLSFGITLIIYFDLWPFTKKQNLNNSRIQQKNTSGELNNITVTPEFTTTENSSSCLVLDEQFCSQGKLVYDNNQLVGIGFKLPEGTKIYSPFRTFYEGEGQSLVEINGKHYSTISLKIIDNPKWNLQDKLTYFFAIGYHQLITEINGSPNVIERGQLFATSGSLTIDNSLGDYNLILTFKDVNTQTGGWSNNFNLLKEIFDYIDI